jgi:hypothetical protein
VWFISIHITEFGHVTSTKSQISSIIFEIIYMIDVTWPNTVIWIDMNHTSLHHMKIINAELIHRKKRNGNKQLQWTITVGCWKKWDHLPASCAVNPIGQECTKQCANEFQNRQAQGNGSELARHWSLTTTPKSETKSVDHQWNVPNKNEPWDATRE